MLHACMRLQDEESADSTPVMRVVDLAELADVATLARPSYTALSPTARFSLRV